MDALIPVNSLSRHIAPLQDTLSQIAGSIIASGYYVLGPNVKAFEQEFAGYCGAAHCVSVANGTDALELSLKALGVGQGDKVAVVANAAMYGTSAVLACGATPIFVDTGAGTGLMSVTALEAALAGGTTPKAVIVTHLYGQLADIEAIVALCQARGIKVVEDCAQAHGAERNGRRAGSFGDISSFSFYPTKNLGALGDGGAIVTSDDALATRAAQLRQYGWTAKYTNSLRGGRNSRLDELQAAMLRHMLVLLDGWNQRRRDIANRYARGLSNPKITAAGVVGADNVAHLYVVRCDEREALRAHLQAAGVQTDVHYPLCDHRQPCHEGAFESVVLPNTEADAACVMTLPCFPELTDEEVDQVIDACNRF
ncbi:DegT/DnrJ/EryC1/StrS family aminotransferase [Xanthomonas hortorum]|uniref:DegT/DnrJ/EryC1/StrS family aminotransferase n=1 Tax=Xanthomonas hortorum pv. hederae TaxID=453603 RepID=A0A9X3YXV5_9XANT|nr:DegT/DnrJ/EryC1/StrS family aminotransferase [Xanthomonas hortorum]MCE4369489.1 DegT/DnrJ/EryC1/StrS family aminotransferase [Xanthomonas hortorum pv. hederae]MDC8636655.1 DegT/DnrJ/EryC1/StrS family aminotransferase [Xanthomonas hortorum pv. hederae]PPU86092.1 erythromycin biosynthesis sensory transduction protein eryC1 [Xanthomonas hortorum pv. hederae]PUF01940.1 DegT/DnrJ/EryC1/StrS family aminotransferase [Xanthomonas hortorum pv. hederae]